MLVAVADELQSGVPVVGAAGLGDALGVGHGLSLMAVVLAGPTLLSLVLEPWVLARSDRAAREPVLRAGLLGMVLFPLLAAVSPWPWTVPWLVGCWGTSAGIACGIAQGALVTGDPEPDRAMSRWTLGSVAGDVLAPLTLGVVGALGLSWRAALALGTVVPLVVLVATRRLELPPLVPEDEDEPSPAARVEALRSAVFPWLLAIASCTLLDEILLALVALRLGDRAGAPFQELALLAGGSLGLVAVERGWVAGRRGLLVASALGSALALVAWTLTDATVPGAACLLLLGASSSLHYPLCKAAAYDAVPGRPGLVGALDGLLAPLDVLAPLAVGAVASLAGERAAAMVLLLQPLCVGVVALAGPPGRGAADGKRGNVC